MRALLAVFALAATVACGSRQVDVSSGTSTQSSLSLTVTNNETQPVSVYVVQGGNPMFVKEVAARSTETVSVPGIAAGSSVTLRAVRADGSRTYNKDVTLTGSYNWTVP
jgi:biopolymer transport protein ExbD